MIATTTAATVAVMIVSLRTLLVGLLVPALTVVVVTTPTKHGVD